MINFNSRPKFSLPVSWCPYSPVAVQGSINDRFVKIVIINNFGYSPRTRGDARDEEEKDDLLQSRRVN